MGLIMIFFCMLNGSAINEMELKCWLQIKAQF